MSNLIIIQNSAKLLKITMGGVLALCVDMALPQSLQNFERSDSCKVGPLTEKSALAKNAIFDLQHSLTRLRLSLDYAHTQALLQVQKDTTDNARKVYLNINDALVKVKQVEQEVNAIGRHVQFTWHGLNQCSRLKNQ
jgi:hypothetical protein